MLNNSFPKNRAVYEVMWKIILDPDRSQMTVRRMRIACWIGKVTDARKTSNNPSFSSGTMVTRKRLIFTFYVHCFSC